MSTDLKPLPEGRRVRVEGKVYVLSTALHTEGTMRWVADQGEYIARLARLPFSGDEANVNNLRAEAQRILDVLA